MSALSKRIAKGQPKGRRDTLRIQGTGCICAQPEYREVPSGDTTLTFLNAKVVSNNVRTNADGTADQFSEFTDLVMTGNRAKALAKVLAKGQIVEFAGPMRSRSFESNKHFDSEGKPAMITRHDCLIGQSGWVHIMKDAPEGVKANIPENQAGAAADNNQALATVLQGLLKQMQATATPQTPAEEALVLENALEDDDVPF